MKKNIVLVFAIISLVGCASKISHKEYLASENEIISSAEESVKRVSSGRREPRFVNTICDLQVSIMLETMSDLNDRIMRVDNTESQKSEIAALSGRALRVAQQCLALVTPES